MLPKYDSDIEIGKLLSLGDERAFQHFYNRYWERIYLMALTYLKSEELSQDIVQDVFLKVWDQREIFSSVQQPGSFIFIMGRNTVINAFRKKIAGGRIVEEPTEYIPDNVLLPHQVIDIKQLQQRLDVAIDGLPPQQGLIFKLSREQGLTHKEIAELLAIDKFTVKNHIIRALKTLRRQLQISSFIALGSCTLSLFQSLQKLF